MEDVLFTENKELELIWQTITQFLKKESHVYISEYKFMKSILKDSVIYCGN